MKYVVKIQKDSRIIKIWVQKVFVCVRIDQSLSIVSFCF